MVGTEVVNGCICVGGSHNFVHTSGGGGGGGVPVLCTVHRDAMAVLCAS